MSRQDLEILIHAFKHIQNAAGVLTRTKRTEHLTPVIKSLHWLPVNHRIDFKILLVVYKSITGMGPKYLSDLPALYTPDRVLRSSGSSQLVEPNMVKLLLATMLDTDGISFLMISNLPQL